MDKNTILAIILSSIVLFGYFVFDALYLMPKRQAAQESQLAEQQLQEQQKEEKAEELNALISSGEDEELQEGETVQEYTITTSKAKIVLTNRGGDVVSYQLLEHLDKDTGKGVEMVDNVTSSNRAFSLSFGDSTAPAISNIFKAKLIDDYTIGFYRDFTQKDESGKVHSFRLGKLYTFLPDDYAFRLSVTINTDDSSTDALNVGGVSYTLRTSPQIGPHYDRKSNRYEVRQFLSWGGNKRTRKPFSSRYYDHYWDWAGAAGKYFTIIVKPEDAATMARQIRCSSDVVDGYENSQVFLTRNAIEKGNTTDDYYIYVGPRSESELIKYNNADKNGWHLVKAMFNQALQTSGALHIFEVALKWALEMINRLAHNWGVSIIILTIILKIALFPLNKSTAMGSIKMQQLQPKMQEIQNKYKDNPQQQQAAVGKLYKEAGYNPASGCLPMVLQMVVLFSLYNVFNNYFEFRGASFIKGWIDDLSVGDSVLTWEKNIPFISGFTMNTLRILPIIYTGSQLLNGVITQYGGAAGAQSQSSMKFMMYGMPLMFFFLFYNVPSGLLLYWTVSNILQIGQQVVINGMTKKKRAELEQAENKKKNIVTFKSSGRNKGKKHHRK